MTALDAKKRCSTNQLLVVQTVEQLITYLWCIFFFSSLKDVYLGVLH